MSTLLDDIRQALRALRAAPSFTAVAVLTLALGIGANTAIFSVVYDALIRPLPYPGAERVMELQRQKAGRSDAVSPPDFVDWRAQGTSFQHMAAFNPTALALSGDAAAQQLAGAMVTSDFFPALQMRPALGRGFTTHNDSAGGNRVVILADALWRQRFAADRSIVGRTIKLEGESYEVIGVMPPGFAYPGSAQLWVPLVFSPQELATQRGAHYLQVIGRLRPSATAAQSAAQMRAIGSRLESEYPKTNAGATVTVRSLRDSLVGDVRAPLLILLGAVGLVLLIACTNVANLQLARAVGREREVAVRTALGASRGRLLRALLTEGAVLSLVGGAAGVLVALWGVDLLMRALPRDIPVGGDVTVSLPALAFTLVTCLLCGLLFSLVPALRLTRQRDLGVALKSGARAGTADRASHRTHRMLVVGETALAVVLLAGAGLLIRSFAELRRAKLGYGTDHLLTFQLALPDARYRTPDASGAFYDRLLDRLRALPGVRTASATSMLPLSGGSFNITVSVLDGRHLSDEEQDRLGGPEIRVITPDYFTALGVPLRRGRAFGTGDRQGASPVAIVNESAARLLWPGSDPLGHALTIGSRLGLDRGRVGGEVVGVVPDTRDASARTPAGPMVFFAHAQYPVSSMTLAVRTTGSPLALVDAIRAALKALDADLPMFEVHAMDELLAADVSRPHFFALLLATFAGAALALAAVGIYGVLAYTVGQRTREIGLRMALGAAERDVLRLVAGGGALMAITGVGLGLAASLLATRLLGGLLYGVGPTDLTSLAAAAGVLMLVAVVATWVPARRAARVAPAVALRGE